MTSPTEQHPDGQVPQLLDLPRGARQRLGDDATELPADSDGWRPPDPVTPRRRYFAVYAGEATAGWPQGQVTVYRRHVPRPRTGRERDERTRTGDIYRLVEMSVRDLDQAQLEGVLTLEQAELLGTPVGSYHRNYSMMGTFEPFRQRVGGVDRDFALISDRYVRSCVMDLRTGALIAVEPAPVDADGQERPGWGFCPVDFLVVDWWEHHDGSILPGSQYWDGTDDRLPDGTWALVAGCHWGDDSSWKVQHLDLSGIVDGVLRRDDRFGYVELPAAVDLHDAVRISTDGGRVRVSLAVEVTFDLADGAADEYAVKGLCDPGYRKYRRPGEADEADEASEAAEQHPAAS